MISKKLTRNPSQQITTTHSMVSVTTTSLCLFFRLSAPTRRISRKRGSSSAGLMLQAVRISSASQNQYYSPIKYGPSVVGKSDSQLTGSVFV